MPDPDTDATERDPPTEPDGSGPQITAPSVVRSLGVRDSPTRRVRLDALADEPPPPRLTQGAARYEVLRLLGEGGMGKVFLAYDQDLRRHVALKMIKDSRPSDLHRFVGEAQVMGQLQHPGIVPVHELGLTEHGRVYYTMPVVRGRTLGDAIAERRAAEAGGTIGEPSHARFAQIVLQVARALSYAHDKGVVHRDLKPSNVMLGQHGEVQVLDWGLSKVLDTTEIDAEHAAESDRGQVAGTPAYMAPEQATAGLIDARADVYALGVMLYECLCLEPPFQGRTAIELLSAAVRDEPRAPRERAPQREVPIELEALCLTAMHKDPARRTPSAAAFGDAIQRWLEAEADRTARRARAAEVARDGEARLTAYRALGAEVARLEDESSRIAARVKPWQPLDEKGPLVELTSRLEEHRKRLVAAEADALGTLELALGHDPLNARARALLADHYWQSFVAAEGRGDAHEAELLKRRVARYHDGRYARELEGDGSLALATDPPGAELTLHELVDDGFVRRPAAGGRSLGAAPYGPGPLAMGSYLVVARREGRRDTLYPVAIGRSRAWTGTVRLHTEAAIGAGFVHVPGGPYLEGGDPKARVSLARAERQVDDFFIAVHPVTNAEYLEFLNDLATTDRDAAWRRSPRGSVDGDSYLVAGADGALRLPDPDDDASPWHPRHPVAAISWHDAVAYAAWRSRRDGRAYRLPTEHEWEKAARGVDGRAFPWGERFDASLCNMRDSHKDGPRPTPVDAFPHDVSIYGVRGLGGNVTEWTATGVAEGGAEDARTPRVLRGGSWLMTDIRSRAAVRMWLEPELVEDVLGFRLAHSPAPDSRG